MAFSEGFIAADGFRIRYLEAGQGPPLVYLHGGGGLRLTRAHDLLARQNRVIALEMPGFGTSPENLRSASASALAATMGEAVSALDLAEFNLMGTSLGGWVALWMAAQQPHRVSALVLEAPAALRPAATVPPWQHSPQELARRLYAHPERLGALPTVNPVAEPKVRNLLQRLFKQGGDPELEARMGELATPTLVLFGTRDGMIPPDMGQRYKALLPNCHLVFVYDAGHLIAAERPEAFCEVAQDFLSRRETFVISRSDTTIHP